MYIMNINLNIYIYEHISKMAPSIIGLTELPLFVKLQIAQFNIHTYNVLVHIDREVATYYKLPMNQLCIQKSFTIMKIIYVGDIPYDVVYT